MRVGSGVLAQPSKGFWKIVSSHPFVCTFLNLFELDDANSASLLRLVPSGIVKVMCTSRASAVETLRQSTQTGQGELLEASPHHTLVTVEGQTARHIWTGQYLKQSQQKGELCVSRGIESLRSAMEWTPEVEARVNLLFKALDDNSNGYVDYEV